MAPADAETLAGLAERFGGAATEDVGQGLRAAALQASGLRRSLALAGRPDLDSLRVSVEDVSGADLVFQPDEDWTWDPAANAFTLLEYVPNVGSVVRAEYLPVDP